MRRGMPLTSGDSSGRRRYTVGSGSSRKGITPILRLGPFLSPCFSTSAFPLPTRPRFDNGSTPTQLLPAPCSVSSLPQKYKPLLVPLPPSALVPIPSTRGWGRAQRRMGSAGSLDGAC
ncbi:hypothetical protein CgunFtcFv8_002054 [Champsocephalus gunnari]|uniref:Uncharacterized protein n=1 Tax=Champsocephalus gunnari TaxID=52237 RepID=A0AAN8CLU7_CHAGU|nr:hypothetical protein CgunFtcFv8_002054 [Champsocephalus gunnari]